MTNVIHIQTHKKFNKPEKIGNIDAYATEIEKRLQKSEIFFDEISIRRLASRIIEFRSNKA